MMTFINVDLPAPLRPISPTRVPGGIAAVARSRIVRPPRRTVMPLMLSMKRRLAGNRGELKTGSARLGAERWIFAERALGSGLGVFIMGLQLPEPMHGWRAFAGEVGVIVLGVLVALTAQHIVQSWQTRQDVDQLRG